MPIFTDKVTNIKFGLEVLQVDLLCYNDMPNKMERQDILLFMQSGIRICGAIDHRFIITPGKADLMQWCTKISNTIMIIDGLFKTSTAG